MAFCSKCGKETKDTDLFCPACGTKISKIISKDSLDPFDYFFLGIKNYFKLSGCSTRKDFWLFFVYISIMHLSFITVAAIDYIKMPAGILQELFGATFSPASIVNLALYYLSLYFFFIPCIAIWVRRMHDINKSGWFILCPVVNIVFLFLKSKTDNNKYRDGGLPSKQQTIVGKIFIILILLSFMVISIVSMLKVVKL